MHHPFGDVALTVRVADAQLRCLDHRGLQIVERRGSGTGDDGAAPPVRVADDGGGSRLRVDAERFRQRVHELAQGRLHIRCGRGGRAGHQKQRPSLRRGEPAEIGARAAQQLPTTVAALARVHG